MNAGDYLDAIRALAVGSLQDLTGNHPFVVLSPHPDDESLGAGGLIAAASSQGPRAEVMVITDGSGSHPGSKRYSRQHLIDLRQAELAEAGRLLGLGPDRVHHLGLVDTQAPSSGAAFDHAVATITETCRKADARSLFVTWDCDPHCDHVAAARMAEAVRRQLPQLHLWAYPIWGWHLDRSTMLERPRPRGLRLDISRHQTIKRAAIAAHVSQMTDLIDDDPDGFRFTDTTLAPFLGAFEYFIEVAP
ncbi:MULTISPECIES: PIG-L deacetylase family protein [Rhodopseudomonas]|uniref:GlcNAc-PI de-N-acetylase n=1 Tax=Rhodopseudomonas palustris TaxID=1076 RepID=A0A0D7F8J1_RHOPL|nr:MULTISPECIES: PIG-L deacetylase family protein [Rhodopseudomonas]KIZ48037.1 GlcNAc-PI de-N-acetylase [Rhodopseudomonas palustris]MDF3810266.1 PIG-L family deacetylase [Rhodopseudomonas sp. BAL398]WOK16049.1 PIG-L deacetylase family protein [Rhodopseudomonas sp. BAL398]